MVEIGGLLLTHPMLTRSSTLTLSFRPERSVVEGPAVPQPASHEDRKRCLPLVIPSEAEGPAVLLPRLRSLLEMFFGRA
jgi:hypothetical protein